MWITHSSNENPQERLHDAESSRYPLVTDLIALVLEEERLIDALIDAVRSDSTCDAKRFADSLRTLRSAPQLATIALNSHR